MRREVEIMAMPEGLLTAASRFGFLSSTAGSPMKKISRFARNDDAGLVSLGVLAFQSPATSPLSQTLPCQPSLW